MALSFALVLLSFATPTVPQESMLTEELFVRFGIQSDKITVHEFHKSYPKVFKSAGVEINSKIKILEIGYSRGNSIPLWENMFPNAEIVSVEFSNNGKSADGIDISVCIPGTSVVCEVGNRSRLYFGDQAELDFLDLLVASECTNMLPCFNVIIDDGGHGYKQQLVSFRKLFASALRPSGLYVIESIETSYFTWGEQYGDETKGGVNAVHTPVNILRNIVHTINRKFHNSRYSADPECIFDDCADKMVDGISFYQNMIAMTKTVDHVPLQVDYRYKTRVNGYSRFESGNSNWETASVWCKNTRKSFWGTNIYDAEAQRLWQDLCLLQAPLNCETAKVVSYRLMGGGIGAAFHLLAHAFSFALADNRTVVESIGNYDDPDIPDATGLGHYFDSVECQKLGLECYLSPLSQCSPVTGDAELPRWELTEIFRHNHDAPSKSPRAVVTAWRSFQIVQQTFGWDAIQYFSPESFSHKGLFWLKSNILSFILQPSPKMVNKVEKTAKMIGIHTLKQHEKVIAMHVRRGDKLTDPIMKQKNIDSFPTLKRYVNEARQLHRAYFDIRGRINILIMTEDSTIIEEIEKNKEYADIRWFYTTDHPRRKEAIKIQHAIKQGLTTGDIELSLALRNLFIASKYCHGFVGTFSSNWSRLVFELMSVKNNNHPVPHASLDLEWMA